MEKSINFENFINKHFKISIAFFLQLDYFGIAYSFNLLGFCWFQTLNPLNLRAVHISLMLYGFVPLMLSSSSFLLINKGLVSLKRIKISKYLHSNLVYFF